MWKPVKQSIYEIQTVYKLFTARYQRFFSAVHRFCHGYQPGKRVSHGESTLVSSVDVISGDMQPAGCRADKTGETVCFFKGRRISACFGSYRCAHL